MSAAASSSAWTSSLRRFCYNVPLPQLVQGSYLTIRSGTKRQPTPVVGVGVTETAVSSSLSSSSLPPPYPSLFPNVPIHVIIEPSWRDNGHIEFRQYFRTVPSKENNVDTDSHLESNISIQPPMSQVPPRPIYHHNNKIQMIVQPNNNTQLQPSKDRNAMVPHITIDLIPQGPPSTQQSSVEAATTLSSNNTGKYDYYPNNLALLPKSNLSPDMEEENSVWMEEIVEEEEDVEEDDSIDGTPTHGKNTDTISTTTSDGTSVRRRSATHFETDAHHRMQPDSYVVLTIQVPEKLNLTCELISPTDHQLQSHNITDDRNDNTNHHPPAHQNASQSSITIRNKIEGDVTLQNTNGNIHVSKLRGHEIHLHATNGIIYASNLLEAQRLTLQCTTATTTSIGGSDDRSSISRIRAKQIHASHLDITVDHRQRNHPSGTKNDLCIMDTDDDEGSLVDVSSMFVSGPNGGAIISVHGPENDNNHGTEHLAHQQRRRAVRIKSHHGPIQVMTNHISKPTEQNPMTEQYYPIVELGGVNGSCEVSIDNTTTQPDDPDDEWSSCMVHIDSLAPESVSLVTANTGHIDVTLDRKTEADVRLASISNMECIPAVGVLLAEEDDNHHIVSILNNLENSNNSSTKDERIEPNRSERISIQTSAFTNRPENALSTNDVSYVDGWVENKSSEPDSRFERKNRGHEGVGKIRQDGAHTQALHSFTDGGSKDINDTESSNKDALRPLLAVVGTEDIRVETVSWLGAIARRYGLEESGRELGRTASRKGRTLSEPNQ